VLETTATLVRHFWKAITGKDATETETSVEVLDVEEGQLGEREAKRALASMVSADPEQEGAA
jgi:hypothetical protein